jgi:hypothetical protein
MLRRSAILTYAQKLFIAVFSLSILLLTIGYPLPAQAEDVQVTDTSVEYTFGEKITFQARIKSTAPIQNVVILFGVEEDTYTESGQAKISPDGLVTYDYELSNHPIRTFSRVDYRFRVSLEGDGVFTSPFYHFYYEDNRFDWQTLDEKPFRVHWYEGDISKAQSVLDVARTGLQRVQQLLNVPSPSSQIEIYVYANSKDMQQTLEASSQDWVAGHADPNLGVMVVALPSSPEGRLLMEQRIPHELMHIMLYQMVGPAYTNLPTWFNEGLASAAELYPNPDYQILLNNAHEKGSLLSITSLCNAFPRDASSALLAYSQSASFVRYLYHTYGTSGLNDMVTTYANGLDCERGAVASTGKTLEQLERQWRQEVFSENANMTGLTNLFPWLVISLAVLLGPLGLIFFKMSKEPANQPVP